MTLDLKTYAAKVRLTDGAWGTQLHKRGLPAGTAGELWNVENAAAVEAVGKSYVDAGSEVILTNTLGANRFMMAGHGLAERAAELMLAGTRISRRAADAAGRDVKVFASMGPSGKIVMMGDVDEQELVSAFAEAAAAAEQGGADAIVLETFNELAEAMLALRGAKQGSRLPVVVSCTFSSGPDRSSTMMGDTPAQLAEQAKALGAAAVGANCGAGPQDYVRVAGMLKKATDLPIWIKPNAGLPVRDAGGKTVFPMGPSEFAGFGKLLAEAGARFIGGCCGTTPEHIAALRLKAEG